MSGFSFGTPTSQVTPKPSGFSFGNLATTSSTATSLSSSFGTSALKTSTSPGGFSLGASVASSTPAFGTAIASTSTSSTGPTLGFGLPGAATLTTAAAVPNLGTPTATPSTSAFELGFGLKPAATTAPSGLSLFAPVTTTPAFPLKPLTSTSAATTAAPFVIPTSKPVTSLGFGIPSTTTTASLATAGFGLGMASTMTTAASSGVTATTTTAASGFSLGGILGTPLSTTAASISAAVTSAKPTTVTTTTPTLTYRQLEDMVNKWTYDLDEQSRNFSVELKRINKSDGALIANAEKISELHSKVDACKAGQCRVEQELEFVESQQRALEDLLEPLEQAAANLPPSQQHADAEREAIFQMCINTDLELGQLLGELREMAERVNGVTADVEGKTLGGHGDATVAGSAASGASGANDANGGFDKTSTVVSQVTRVLNSHIHSLNWLNQNTQELMEKMKFLATS